MLVDITRDELERLQKTHITVLSQEKDDTENNQFTLTKISPEISDEDYWPAFDKFCCLFEIRDRMMIFYKISQKFDTYVSLIILILLFSGFSSWLLVILGFF
jgi:hypothetical protein